MRERRTQIKHLQSQIHKDNSKNCASKYPLDPSAALVLGISNLSFWAGVVVMATIGWIVRGWYIDRTLQEALGRA
jgi:hypothetical protein